MIRTKAIAPGGRAGLLRGPFGGLIGASVGCSAWQVRALAEVLTAGTWRWLILALLFLVSVALSPVVAYYGLMMRRWSGLKTIIVYGACIAATNAAFVAAGRVLAVGGVFADQMLIYVWIAVAAVLAGLLMFPAIRQRVVSNLENWRDGRR